MKTASWTAFVCTVFCAVASSEVAFDTAWTVPGNGGFSAANFVCDAATGKPSALVVCESAVGVVSFDLAGNRLWAYPMTPPVSAPPAVADLDGDGTDDVVAANNTGQVAALNAAGQPLWTAQLPGGVEADSCPAAADLDGDGHPEVLVGDLSGTLSCFDHAGALRWQFSGDGTRMGPVLVADIYDAPGLEIIVPSHDQHVYALSAQGAWLWDLYLANDLFPNSTPLLADVDGDGAPELYIGGGLNHFYRIDPRTHSVALAENVYLHVNNALAAADLDADGKDEVVLGNKGGAVRCYDADGFAWTQDFRKSNCYAAPVFLNLDADPALEILIFSSAGDIQALDADGTHLFSAQSPCSPVAAPLVSDLDGDGRTELVVTNPGSTAGAGNMVWLDLDVPYVETPGVPIGFAGDRAHTCRPPGAKAFPLLPTPTTTPVQAQAKAVPDGPLTLLGGPNTFRFDVENPEGARLALLAELAYPDNSVRRCLRHVYGPAERVAVSFDMADRGAYQLTRSFVDADTLGLVSTETTRLRFDGFKSDRAYLDDVVFAGVEEALAAWRAGNPRGADAFATELLAQRGLLGQLAASDDVQRASRLPALRQSAERLLALARAASVLAPSGVFFAWAFNPWAYFDASESLPTPEDRTESLEASLCIGEYESLALNLTNVCERTLDVRVHCDALEGPEPAVAADHVAFRRAVTVPTLYRERVADALPTLDEAGLLSIPSLESQQLWITVNAKGLKPGEYVARLRLRSVEPDPAEIALAIKLTVHDLELPRPRPCRFCLWSYDGGDLGTDKPEVLDDLVEHGASVFFGHCPEAACDAEGRLTAAPDFTAHDESVKRLSPHGILLFGSPQGSVTGQPFLSEPWRKAFVAYMRAWADHMKTLGVDYGGWALYPYDEPSTPFGDTALNLVEVAKLVREADPNILIYTDPTSGTTMETAAMFSGLIDLWCPSSELLERLGPEIVPFAQRAGKEVWFYDAAGRAKTLSCLGIYRWRFWYAWTLGLKGVGWWCYDRHGPDRWDGPNTTGDFFATVYDGPGGVVSSKRWEVAREGVEDYEYLWMLREAIAAASARGVAEADLADARGLLDTLPSETEAALLKVGRRLPLTPDGVPLYVRTSELMAQARARIVDACLQLKAR